jgi:DNA-binding CsgD family transcriptional regulator
MVVVSEAGPGRQKEIEDDHVHEARPQPGRRWVMSLAEAAPDLVGMRSPLPAGSTTGASVQLVRELRTVFVDLMRLHAQATRIRAEMRHAAPDSLDEQLGRLTESLWRAGEHLADRLWTSGSGGGRSAGPAALATGPHPPPPSGAHLPRIGPGGRAAAGGRERVRGERGAAGGNQGWAALTPAELEVIRVVISGRTNREAASLLFLSPHTISSHLRHAYAKLGINSRVELVRAAMATEADAHLRDPDVTPMSRAEAGRGQRTPCAGSRHRPAR